MGVIVVVQEKKASFTPSEAPFFIDPARVCSSLRDAGHDVFLTCPEETGSTNTDLLVRARRGEASDKTEIRVAHHQTGGRGTHGRSWENARESLLFSIGLPLPAVTPAPIPLLVGFSSAEALRREGVPVFIKWPNDIWTQSGKLGGVLCELAKTPSGDNYLVIGIGLNLRGGEDVASGRYAADSVSTDTADRFCRELRTRLLAGMCGTILSRLQAYFRTGRMPDWQQWTEYDYLMDREIILDNNAGELQTGIYRGISESGALMLQVGDVIRCYAAGTVRFPQEQG